MTHPNAAALLSAAREGKAKSAGGKAKQTETTTGSAMTVTTSIQTRTRMKTLAVNVDHKHDSDEEQPITEEDEEKYLDDVDDDKENPARLARTIPLPNVLPIPAFLVVALMERYTSDAGYL